MTDGRSFQSFTLWLERMNFCICIDTTMNILETDMRSMLRDLFGRNDCRIATFLCTILCKIIRFLFFRFVFLMASRQFTFPLRYKVEQPSIQFWLHQLTAQWKPTLNRIIRIFIFIFSRFKIGYQNFN